MVSTPEQETLQLRALKLQTPIKGTFPLSSFTLRLYHLGFPVFSLTYHQADSRPPRRHRPLRGTPQRRGGASGRAPKPQPMAHHHVNLHLRLRPLQGIDAKA